jgi:vacuolar-type H+-ATPase subunit F/Vma7
MKELIYDLFLHKNDNLTKDDLEGFEIISKLFFGKEKNLTNISKKHVVSPMKIYVCESSSHQKENTLKNETKIYRFFYDNYCTYCNSPIDSSSYLFFYNFIEVINHLFDHFLEDCKRNQFQSEITSDNEIKEMIKKNFNFNTKIHDVDSGLLIQILKHYRFFNDVDIAIIALENHDSTDLGRKTSHFKNVIPFYLKIANLPPNLNSKKDFLQKIGKFL